MSSSENKLEKKILKMFSEKNISFSYEGKEYTVEFAGKPQKSSKKSNGGEAKTDLFIRAKDIHNNIKDFKISIKEDTADFIENKMNSDRARFILGEKYKERIRGWAAQLLPEFNGIKLYHQEGRFEGSITLGWIPSFMNKINGKLSKKVELSEEELIEIYSGKNLPDEKKNCKVNGNPVPDSGVAEFILVENEKLIQKVDDVIKKILKIEDYVKENKEIYIAFKALNFRTYISEVKKSAKSKVHYYALEASNGKCDGNRPLAVSVDWKNNEGIISGELIIDHPWEKEAITLKDNLIGVLGKINNINDVLAIDKHSFTIVDKKINLLVLDKGNFGWSIFKENNINRINELKFNGDKINSVDAIVGRMDHILGFGVRINKDEIKKKIEELVKINAKIIVLKRYRNHHNTLMIKELFECYGYQMKKVKLSTGKCNNQFDYIVFTKVHNGKDFILKNKIVVDNNKARQEFCRKLNEKYINSGVYLSWKITDFMKNHYTNNKKDNNFSFQINLSHFPWVRCLCLEEIMILKSYPSAIRNKNIKINKNELIKTSGYDEKQMIFDSIYRYLFQEF